LPRIIYRGKIDRIYFGMLLKIPAPANDKGMKIEYRLNNQYEKPIFFRDAIRKKSAIRVKTAVNNSTSGRCAASR
jgi:hypothetical protein